MFQLFVVSNKIKQKTSSKAVPWVVKCTLSEKGLRYRVICCTALYLSKRLAKIICPFLAHRTYKASQLLFTYLQGTIQSRQSRAKRSSGSLHSCVTLGPLPWALLFAPGLY